MEWEDDEETLVEEIKEREREGWIGFLLLLRESNLNLQPSHYTRIFRFLHSSLNLFIPLWHPRFLRNKNIKDFVFLFLLFDLVVWIGRCSRVKSLRYCQILCYFCYFIFFNFLFRFVVGTYMCLVVVFFVCFCFWQLMYSKIEHLDYWILGLVVAKQVLNVFGLDQGFWCLVSCFICQTKLWKFWFNWLLIQLRVTHRGVVYFGWVEFYGEWFWTLQLCRVNLCAMVVGAFCFTREGQPMFVVHCATQLPLFLHLVSSLAIEIFY